MLAGKVVAITGASSGIGAEMSQSFSKQGAKVLLMSRSETKLARLSDRIGDLAEPHVLDVASSRQVRDVFDAVRERHGRIDVLVNNAGFGIFRAFGETSDTEVEQMMEVNYFGMVRCTRAALPLMVKQGTGHIINIGSIAGKVATAKAGAYAATKHAMLGFTASLRQELQGTGIVVSVVNPGPVRTPFLDHADPSGSYLRSLPSRFVLEPGDVAQAVVKVAQKRNRERNLPVLLGLSAKLYNLFPGWCERMAGRMFNKK